jgi:hypothetical protein
MPAMTNPKRKRRNLRLQGDCTAAKQDPTTPVAKTILAIQTRGLSLLIMRFDGKSKMT